MSETETAISLLANNMRLYAEAQLRFGGLAKVDREEAINNVDRTFESTLEAFHTLYDVSKADFPYFGFADTCLLIALRNALHHRNHPLFRSLNTTIWLDGDADRLRGAAYLLARHRVMGDAPILMRHHFKLDDFCSRLNPALGSQFCDTMLSAERALARFRVISNSLSFERIYERGRLDRYPSKQVYLDVVPILISAVARVFKAMHDAGARFRGFDAETYLDPFTTEIAVDLDEIDFSTMRI